VIVDISGAGPDAAPVLLVPPLEQPIRRATGTTAARQYTSLLMCRMIPSLSLFTRVLKVAVAMWWIYHDVARN
jgi:hypothetical protein